MSIRIRAGTAVLLAGVAFSTAATGVAPASASAMPNNAVAKTVVDTSCAADEGFGVGTGPMPKYVAHPAKPKLLAKRLAAVTAINDAFYGNRHFGCARYDGTTIRVTIVKKHSPTAQKLIARVRRRVPGGSPLVFESAKYSSRTIHATRARILTNAAELRSLGMDGFNGWYDGQSLHSHVSVGSPSASIAKIRALFPEPYVVVDTA